MRNLPPSTLAAGAPRSAMQGALGLGGSTGCSRVESASPVSPFALAGSARSERLTVLKAPATEWEKRSLGGDATEGSGAKDSAKGGNGTALPPAAAGVSNGGSPRASSARPSPRGGAANKMVAGGVGAGGRAGAGAGGGTGVAAPAEGRRDDLIAIHVCDDQRRISRDFYCSRELLLANMLYFQSYLSGARRYEDIDISVHCDVHIFEWLMEYIHEPTTPPQLDPATVVSILISANFLGMRELVEVCLGFFKQNAAEVVRLPLDLGCLNDELLTELAQRFEPEEIERMRDKKDRLASRLYEKKIDEVLSDEEEQLRRCAYCHKHFTDEQRDWESCLKAPVLVDFHGNAIAEHVANKGWSVSAWVAQCRKGKAHSARELFWRIWSLTHFLNCSECGQPFPLAELDHCSYHPQPAAFEGGDSCGVYPCCGQPAVRFELSAGRRRGCRAKRHTPDLRSRGPGRSTSAAQARLFETAVSLAELVLTSFEPADHVQAQRRGRDTSEDRLSDAGSDSDDEPIALQSIKPSRPDRKAAGSAGSSDQSSSSDTDSSHSDSSSHVKPGQALLASAAAGGTIRAARRGTAPNGEVGRAGTAAGGGGRANGGPSWRVETQQRNDNLRFADLCRGLEACRRDAGPVCKDGPSGDKAPSLAGPKAFFLDRRFIMLMTRNGAISVVWPRSNAAVAAKRRPAHR